MLDLPRDINVKTKQTIAKDQNLVIPLDLNSGKSRVDLKSQMKNKKQKSGTQAIFGFAN